MTRTARLGALTLLFVALVPAAAHAAVVREYQLQYSPAAEPTTSMLIVTAVIDPSASLPATVTIPVPAGSTLLWAGEVLGGDPAADPFREADKKTVDVMDLYTFSVEQVRLAQVEVSLGPPTVSGTRISGTMSWTNPGDEVLVSASLVAEPGATDIKTTPAVTGAVQQNSVGETLHPLGGVRLATGGTYVIEASWKRGGGGGPSESTLLPILIGALMVAVVALVIVLARERTRVRRAGVDA